MFALGEARKLDEENTGNEAPKPESGTVMDDEKQNQLIKLLKQEYHPLTLE